jgi:hypothetical protein
MRTITWNKILCQDSGWRQAASILIKFCDQNPVAKVRTKAEGEQKEFGLAGQGQWQQRQEK